MKRLAAFAAVTALSVAAMAFSSVAFCATESPRPIEHANVLPLALDDHFQFRKVEQFLNDPAVFKPTSEPMLEFERRRVNFKAVTGVDRLEKRGHYFTFFWRADRLAPITVRLEYRQENLGAYVQAREVSYNRARLDRHEV